MAPKDTTQQETTSVAPSTYSATNAFSGVTASSGTTGVSEGFKPKGNYLTAPQISASGGLYSPAQRTSVSGIVNPDNTVTNFYDLTTAPGEILGSLNDVARSRLITELQSRGWYGSSKSEGGFGDNDRAAMRDLLYYSNVQGRSFTEVLNTVAKAPITGAGGGGAVKQVSSTEDLIAIANKTALATIGKKLSPEQTKAFSQAYQQAQRADMGGAPQNAPSADVFFQNRIEQQYGAETDAYKYLGAISNVAKLLESL
jgi:hypothetical protein